MFVLILSFILTLLGAILSVSIYIASIASVMKIYEVIDDTWFMIWDFPVYIFMLWLSLVVFSIFSKTNYNNKNNR